MDLVAKLREEIMTESDSVGAESAHSAEEEAIRLSQILAKEGVVTGSVADAIDEFLANGEGLEPKHRQRLVGAANRALQRIRGADGPLQSLLESAREEGRVAASLVAGRMQISEERFLELERGSVPLDKEEPAAIAAWIQALGVKALDAIQALRWSLGVAQTGQTYGGRLLESAAERTEAERFLELVEEALEDHNSTSTT